MILLGFSLHRHMVYPEPSTETISGRAAAQDRRRSFGMSACRASGPPRGRPCERRSARGGRQNCSSVHAHDLSSLRGGGRIPPGACACQPGAAQADSRSMRASSATRLAYQVAGTALQVIVLHLHFL